MNNSHIVHGLRPRPATLAALFLLIAAIPVHLPAQAPPGAPPAAAKESERETMDFEGMRIVFPMGEADVVEQLKPALRKYREERRRAVEAEAKELAESLSDTATREMLRQPVAKFMAREAASDQYDARWASQAVTMRALADAWRTWSGDLSELQLWRREELAPFQARPEDDGDGEKFQYRFPQVSYGQNGARFSLRPPFLAPLLGLDFKLKLTGETKPLRLDIPLLYKPGESPEEIAKYGRKFLEELPAFFHREFSRGFGITTPLLQCTFENLFLGEVEAVVVEPRTAQETALADGIARILLFAQILKQDGEAKTIKYLPKLFPFGIGGWDLSDPEAIFRILEKLDPLAKVERTNVTERIFARNLIALTLLEIAQKDPGGAPILHKFKNTGVAIPAGGFTMDSFCTAVDVAYGEKDFFRRTLAAKKAKTLEELREGAAQRKAQIAKGGDTPAVKTSAAPAAPPNRESAKFDGLTITYPAELKAAVAIVGPEYSKMLAKARASMEALCQKAPGPDAVEEASVDADTAALRAYGIEPNPNVIREFAVLVGVMRNGAQLSRWFVSGDRMQIWVKEGMLSFLKGGGKLPDFSLAPNGEGVSWDIQFSLSDKILDADKSPSASPAEARAKIVKRIDAIPRPEYPIVLKRDSLPASLDDPAAVASAIRADEGKIFGVVRETAETPEGASRNIATFSPLFDQGQAWFMVAHEATESAIVDSVIKSADRRWFCDGLANWVAMQDVDRRFGPGKGAEAFAKNYNADEMRKQAAKVDLLAWPTEEDVKSGLHPEVEESHAHYYFATLVMAKACEGRGADFVKTWLDEIRKTPLNRANGGTVLAAYQKLTGKDLKDMMGEVVK